MKCAAAPPTPVSVAEDFIAAMNGDDVDRLLELSNTPFHFRRQEWRTASDGYGFTLGPPEDSVFSSRSDLRTFFDGLVRTVSSESVRASEDASPKELLLDEVLGGTPAAAAHVDLFVFVRGWGDVEHVAIVGIDNRRGKVGLLYLN